LVSGTTDSFFTSRFNAFRMSAAVGKKQMERVTKTTLCNAHNETRTVRILLARVVVYHSPVDDVAKLRRTVVRREQTTKREQQRAFSYIPMATLLDLRTKRSTK
jgi:hypothetical protein